MDVNDNAGSLTPRSALSSIANSLLQQDCVEIFQSQRNTEFLRAAIVI